MTHTPEEKRLLNNLACKKWREENPEYNKQRQVDYWAAHPEKKKAKYNRWRAKDPNHARQLSRESYARNKQNFTPCSNEYEMYKAAKRRAKNKNVPFTISLKDIVISMHCPVLGLKLSRGRGRMHDCSPTLDRIIPELGYIPGNIVVMSHRANTIKSCGTLEEHQMVVDFLRRNA